MGICNLNLLSVFDTFSNQKFLMNVCLCAFLLIARIETAGTKSASEFNFRDHSIQDERQPHIDGVRLNTTVYVGQTAYLPCVVKHLGDKTVSWIRRRDLHILTSGIHTYTSDPRVSILREGKLLNTWILKIMTVGKKDEGYYECQVNTEPKMTAAHYLAVFGSLNDDSGSSSGDFFPRNRDKDKVLPQLDNRFDPKRKGCACEAKIIGPQYVYVKEGHFANFTCVISHLTESPNVTWFLDDVPIQRSSATRGGISLDTQKSHFSTISKLVISRVFERDEGKYTCGGDAVIPAHVYLRIAPYNSREEEEKKGVNELSGPMLSIANSNSNALLTRWSQDKESKRKMYFFLTFSFFIDFPPFFFSFLKSSFLLPFLNPLLLLLLFSSGI